MNFVSSLTGNAGVGGSLDVSVGDVQKGTNAAAKAGNALGGDVGQGVAKVAGSAAAGASLGSVVPGFGTAVGGLVGGVIGLFESIGPNPHPGMDDAYWNVLGKKGSKGHEPNGLNISSEQASMVQKYVSTITRHPDWQVRWPDFWNSMAHAPDAHSSLLANAVARYLHAPENGGAMITPRMMADSIVHTFVLALTTPGCPGNDQYLHAAHAALTRAQQEGPQVLSLVQQKVSLVESFGLAANGLTAQVAACRARPTRPVPVKLKITTPPAPKIPVAVSHMRSAQWWAEVFVASTVAVGLGMGVQKIVSDSAKKRTKSG